LPDVQLVRVIKEAGFAGDRGRIFLGLFSRKIELKNSATFLY